MLLLLFAGAGGGSTDPAIHPDHRRTVVTDDTGVPDPSRTVVTEH